MEKDSSPLDTLRQLKEWLDAGTITPEEFQALKQKLVFAKTAPPPAPNSATAPASGSPIAAPTAAEPADTVGPPAPAPSTPPTEAPFSRPLGAVQVPASPAPANSFRPPEPRDIGPGEYAPDEAAPPPGSSLTAVLVVGGLVLLLALVAYLVLDGRGSERLTSATRTAADSVAVRPEIGPQTEQLELPPVAAPETVRVAPAAPPVIASSAPDTATQAAPNPAAASAPNPAAASAPAAEPDGSAVSDDEARARVESVLQRYYADLQAAPFTAVAYFAPQVERFYLLQNTTPAAINAELEKTHFPEFLEAQTSIRPGTLQLSPPAADGSRVATFVETSNVLRQSLQKHQQTAAQVRIRFDKNIKIVYLRQEKLLENNFTE